MKWDLTYFVNYDDEEGNQQEVSFKTATDAVIFTTDMMIDFEMKESEFSFGGQADEIGYIHSASTEPLDYEEIEIEDFDELKSIAERDDGFVFPSQKAEQPKVEEPKIEDSKETDKKRKSKSGFKKP